MAKQTKPAVNLPAREIVMNPVQAALYQQGHLWANLGFSLTSRDVINLLDNPNFIKGYNDGAAGIMPRFAANVSTPAYYRGV